MSAWNEEEWQNEYHFIGPVKTLWELQMEMNNMGAVEPPWQIHGWEKIDKEWYALMLRSTVKVDKDKEKVKK